MRTRRQVTLTEAGRLFLGEARALLARADEAAALARRADRGEAGRLAIGFVSSAGYALVPDALRAYRARYPDVTVALRDLSTATQARALADGALDVGVLRPPVGRTSVALAVEAVRRDPLLAVLPAAHPLAAWPGERLAVAALADEPFVLFPPGGGLADDYEDCVVGACAAGFSPRVAQEAREMATILGLVAAGLGVSLAPASARRLRSEGVVYRPLSDTAAALDHLALAWREDTASPLVRAFLAVARVTISGSGDETIGPEPP